MTELAVQSEWAEPLISYHHDGYLRSEEVVRLVGCTYRKLDYWVRAGLIVPIVPANGQGSSRLFDETAVRHVRIITRLTAVGVRLEVFRRFGVETAALLLADELDSVVKDLVED